MVPGVNGVVLLRVHQLVEEDINTELESALGLGEVAAPDLHQKIPGPAAIMHVQVRFTKNYVFFFHTTLS